MLVLSYATGFYLWVLRFSALGEKSKYVAVLRVHIKVDGAGCQWHPCMRATRACSPVFRPIQIISCVPIKADGKYPCANLHFWRQNEGTSRLFVLD